MYETCGLAKLRLNHNHTESNVSLECSMNHPTGIFRAMILSPENKVDSIYDIVTRARLPDWLFKAIITTTAVSLPSSTLHSPKCDWWECPGWPSSVPWHTGEGKDLWERNRGMERGRVFELFWCHSESQWAVASLSYRVPQYITVKVAPLTTWQHAKQGYNSSGALGIGTSHLQQDNRGVKEMQL